MHANVHTLNLIGVRASFLFSALVISSSSAVGTFNVRDSIFLGNIDGIDIGQGVQYMVLSRSAMNNTGSWYGDGEDLNFLSPGSVLDLRSRRVFYQCNSALMGSPRSIKVEYSVFAHNHASGVNCQGCALYLTNNGHRTPPLLSNNETLDNENPLIMTIEVVKSVFYDNIVENCSVANSGGGGAVTVYGLQLLIKIVDTAFVKNQACKGAGLYIAISDRWLVGLSQNRSTGQVVSLRIIIDTCEFSQNIAESGGGLMTELTESMLDTGSSLSTLIYNSSFYRNNASSGGAGVYLHYFNVSLNSGVSVMTRFSNTDFKQNINRERGGGTYIYFTSLSLMFHASVRTVVNNCTFTSNRARSSGAGIYIRMLSCSIHSNSSFILEASHSTFTSNSAWEGAGIYTDLFSCSLHSNSSFIFEASLSTFTSNTAVWDGAGIYTSMRSCSLYSNSSLTLQIFDSIFTSNAAGIHTAIKSCSLYANSSLTLLTSHSTFTSNTAWYGAGIYIYMSSCSLYPSSSFIFETSHSIFTFNTARRNGAGINTHMQSIFLHPNSSLKFEASHSIFTSNTADWGAAVSTAMYLCFLYSNSSLTLQISHSTFTSNTGKAGAGIFISCIRCNLYPNSSLTLQTSHSIFTSNTAWRGSGISTYIKSCSLYSNSSLALQTSHSTFRANTADRGAGLSVQHISNDTCISGEIAVLVTECRFLNNSASKEGGSLYLWVFPLTKLYIKQSVFENNRAFPGSGLHRENTKMIPTCNNTNVYDIKTQILITTHIIQCLFIENIDTAVLVNNKYGTLAIKKCLFKNNRCIKSLFAEDIFTDIDLEMTHTKILRDKNNPRTISIISQTDAKLDNVTVSTLGIPNQRQIRIATFSHFITQAKGSSFEYQCPAFYQPSLSPAGLTYVGALVLKATCDACFEGYYVGKLQIAISKKNEGNNHCYEKDILNEFDEVIGTNKLCYTNTTGTCIECPHGANCSAGVVSIPNYWGHMTTADRLEFHRCPVGYCCNQTPCEGIDQCAAHREGTLCGRCAIGFTESLITPECIPDKTCRDWWIFPSFCLWAFTLSLIIVFSQDILQIKDTIIMRMGRNRSREEKKKKALGQVELGETKLKSQCDTEIRSCDTSVQSCDTQIKSHGTEVQSLQASCKRVISNNMQGRKMQTSSAKVPILWGMLTIMREENPEASGSHKYLQIMLYTGQVAIVPVPLSFNCLRL